MVAKLVDCEANKSTFDYDLMHDVHAIKLGPQLDDGIKDGVDGSCIESLRVGGVSGGHDVRSMTICHLFRTFLMACLSMAFSCTKILSFCKTTCSDLSSLLGFIFNSFHASWR